MFISFLFSNISKGIEGLSTYLKGPLVHKGIIGQHLLIISYLCYFLCNTFFLIQLIFYFKPTFEIEFLSILLVPFQVYEIKPFSFAEKFVHVMSVMLSALGVVLLSIMKLLENQNINLKMPVLK